MSGMITSWFTIGIRRLGGDDAGLGEPDVAPADDALLGMADGGALHRALHGTRAAAGAHVQAAQAELVADLLGVLVFLVADRMSAPADDQVGLGLEVEHARVAQDVEHRVGDGRGIAEVEAAAFDDLVGDEDHVAQHREHVFLDAADHLAVDEGLARRVLHLELDAPGLAHQLHLEILVAVEDFLGVVALAAGIHARPARTCGTAGRGRRRANRAVFRSRPVRGFRGCRAVRCAHPRNRE